MTSPACSCRWARGRARVAAVALAAALLLVPAIVSADDAVEIRWRYEPDTLRVYESSSEVMLSRQVGTHPPGKVHLEIEQRVRETSGKKNDEGLLEMWRTVEKVLVDLSYGKSHLVYDSTDPKLKRLADHKLIKPFAKDVGLTGYFHIDPKAGSSKVPGGEGAFLAGRKVVPGGTWTETRRERLGDAVLEVTERYTMRRERREFLGRARCIFLDVAVQSAKVVEAPKDADGKELTVEILSAAGEGLVVFDPKAGVVVRRELKQTLRTRRPVPKQGGGTDDEVEDRRLETVVELVEDRPLDPSKKKRDR